MLTKKTLRTYTLSRGLEENPLAVRYRVDGLCHISHEVPPGYKKALLSRLKIMSNLDITERRKPQSGKIVIRYMDKKIEYRVETTPTVGGNEDAVLRVLTKSKPIPLDNIGFSGRDHKTFEAAGFASQCRIDSLCRAYGFRQNHNSAFCPKLHQYTGSQNMDC